MGLETTKALEAIIKKAELRLEYSLKRVEFHY